MTAAPSPSPAQPPELTDSEWLARLEDDEHAPRLLDAEWVQAEPVPDWMAATAALAWRSRDPDAQLAELIEAEEAVSAARDAFGETRTFVFEAVGCHIAVTVREDVDGPSVDGIVSSASGLSGVTMGWEEPDAGGSPLHISTHGRFLFEPGAARRVRLRLGGPFGVAVTPWFRVR